MSDRTLSYFFLLLPLFFVLSIPALLTLFVPRRYLGFWIAWVVMVGIVYKLWPTGEDHSSPFSGTGEAFDALIFMAVAVVVGIKIILIIIFSRGLPAPPRPYHPALWTFTGMLAGAFAVTVLALVFAATRPAWVAHAAAAGAILVALALLACSWKAPSLVRRSFALALVGGAVALDVAVGIRIWSGIGAVAANAEAIAVERPYCIQVVGGRSGSDAFEPATHRLDLSPLTMRTKCREGWCWQNHAILVIDDGSARMLKNWSYNFKGFRDDVLNVRTKPPAVVCQPRAHFARDLPWL